MGNLFFGLDVQALVSDSIGPGDLPPCTLRKYTPGTPTPGVLTGSTNPTSIDYITRGVVGKFTYSEIKTAPQIQGGDCKVTMIAKPLVDAGVEPAVDDEVIVGTKVMRVVWAKCDPAVATWKVACRA